jgi:cell division protein FtsI/penicillin-binding protein 2
MNKVTPMHRRNTHQRSTVEAFVWRFRLSIIIVFGATSLGLVLQMYRWQVNGYDRFSELARSQVVTDERLPSSRGTIYAADGSVLAVDEPVWDVYASVSLDDSDRERFNQQKEVFIQEASRILDLDEETVSASLVPDFQHVLLKKAVSMDEKNALDKAKLFGLFFEEKEKRIYPQGSLASHVIGFVGKNDAGEDVGNYGLEGYYAGDLLGVEGFKYEEKDSRGNVILTGEYDPVIPREGKNIVLTIEPGLQHRVETLIEKGVKDQKAKSGSVIVMDPATGAILAMANYPTFNPTYYWREDDPEVFRNKAVSDVYEYGSVNKVMTLSMALEEGEITPETECIDDTGSIEVIDKTIYTWDRNPDGVLLPKDILRFSNNVCAVKTGQKVGIERFYNYMRKFGIGDFIGIGLQDEATSYLPPIEKWTLVDLAAASFGQAISATPLQITSAISTIANDGVRMRPYIVDRIFDESEEIDIEPEVLSRVVSVKTAQEMQDMMEVVVREGEAKSWFKRISQYSVAGKTGTAEIPYKDKYGYQTDKTNVTFVGFSPVHNAKMVMIVRLEEPGVNTLSAYTVVPVWIEIFENIALDLGIAPQ